MPSLEVVQTNFTRGELSPRLRGRLDFEGFFNGVAKMRDFLPVVQGAAVKRPGTRHVDRQDDAERLVPFEFSVEQTYVFAFGDGGIEFYTDTLPDNGAQLATTVRQPKTRLTATNPNFTLQNGDFSNGLTGWTTTSGGNSSVAANNERAELQAVPNETATLEQEITVPLSNFDQDHYLRFDIGTVAAKKSQEVVVRVGSAASTGDIFRRVLPPGSHIIKFRPPNNNNVFLGFDLVNPDVDSTVFIDNVERIRDEPIRLKTPYSADEIGKLFWAQSADVLFLTHANHFPRELRRFSRDEFSLVFYDFQDGPWDDVNLTDVELSTGANSGRTSITATSASAINDGRGFQDSDIGRLVRFRPDNTNSKSIQGDGSTNVFTFSFAVDSEEDVRVTLTNTGSSGAVQNIGEGATIEAIPEVDYKLTLDENGAGGTVDFSISKPPASDIEVNITRDNTFWGWAEIVAIETSTSATIVIRNDGGFAGTGPTTSWRLGSWTGTDSGFPHVVTFHDQRLGFGSSFRSPQNLWLSKVAAFDNHSPTEPDGTVNADNGINVRLATSQVNFIRWMSSFSNGLAVGTSGSEFLVRKGGTSEPLSPENIEVQKQTRRGSAPFVPEANIGHSIFFLQRDRQTLREAAFDFDTNGLIARDLSVFSEHLLRPGISRMAYQQSPESILWLLTDEGNLVALTIESDQNVFSWTQHNPGGTVKSLTTITDPASDSDQLWVLVEREINGTTVRHIDFLEEFWFEDRDGVDEAFYVDSGITLDNTGPGISLVDREIDHLEGQEVAILADGAVADRQTVSGGQVPVETNTESRKANTVHVGLPYTSEIETFPYDQGQRGSTSRGKVKRISEIEILFAETVGILYGRKTLDRLPFRSSADEMDQPVKPFTGPIEVAMPADFKPEAFAIIQSDQPLPATILTLTVDMVFEDL